MSWLRAPAAFPLDVAAMFNLASADKVALATVKWTDQKKLFVVWGGVSCCALSSQKATRWCKGGEAGWMLPLIPLTTQCSCSPAIGLVGLYEASAPGNAIRLAGGATHQFSPPSRPKVNRSGLARA